VSKGVSANVYFSQYVIYFSCGPFARTIFFSVTAVSIVHWSQFAALADVGVQPASFETFSLLAARTDLSLVLFAGTSLSISLSRNATTRG
jgi:hypothetical protein